MRGDRPLWLNKKGGINSLPRMRGGSTPGVEGGYQVALVYPRMPGSTAVFMVLIIFFLVYPACARIDLAATLEGVR